VLPKHNFFLSKHKIKFPRFKIKFPSRVSNHMEQLASKFLTKYHRDPLTSCLQNQDYSNPYFKLQLLHLIADEEDLPAVEDLMAEHAASIVSKPEHLLAMDTSKDYRGDFWTPREFNDEAYEVGMLFHKKKVDPTIFLPYVRSFKLKNTMNGDQIRKSALKRVHKRRIYSILAKRLGVDDASLMDAIAKAPDGLQGASIIAKLSDEAFKRNIAAISRAVAVSQDWRLLHEAIKKSPAHKLRLMRSFVMGKDLDCGKAPIDELRAICQWG